MPSSLAKELLDRLICAKYVFRKGADILDQGGAFSSGLAVLHFQDSAEMVLRVIAEHLHCTVKENAAFNQILDAIDNKGDRKLTHRSALNQLNKARINFKHFGLEPKNEDVTKFRRDLEAFFPTALRSFLDVDFDSISLTILIGHRRTENFLNEAERLINAGEYEASIRATAIAFAVYRAHHGADHGLPWRDPFREFEDPELDRWANSIEEIIANQQSQLNLIMDGISLADYRRFQRYIPIVHLSEVGTYRVVNPLFGRPVELTRDAALFCHRFAVEALLLMKSNQLPPRSPTQQPKRRFRVVKKSDVVVWPCENPEVIREAEVGETVLGRANRYDRPDYFAVIQDGDDAYINKDAVVAFDL